MYVSECVRVCVSVCVSVCVCVCVCVTKIINVIHPQNVHNGSYSLYGNEGKSLIVVSK